MIGNAPSSAHIFVAVAALAAAAPAFSADALTAEASLSGVPAFRVVVERLPPGIEESLRLRRDELQAIVEARLARASIAVAQDAPALLYVNVAAVCDRLSCAFNVAVEVQQPVRLEARPAAGPLVAVTWSTGSTGIAARRPSAIRVRVREQADAFVEAYRAANPRK